MITAWDIYWITRLDYIIGTSVFLFIVSLISVAGLTIARMVAHCDDTDWRTYREWREPYRKNFPRRIALALVPFFVFLSVMTFVPDTENACAIYLLPKIANNEQVQKIPDKFAKLLNVKMEEWMNDAIIDKKETK